MVSDIKLVRLTRTAMEGEKYQKLQEYGIWYVADYFDIMQVKDLSLEQPFSEWLDIRGDNIGEHEIAEQSYTLYCSSTMLKQYEFDETKPYRRNPFEKEDDMECLSIIQVYITPEILARMDNKIEEVCFDNGNILKPFVEDLYNILDIFSVKNREDSFAARVYLMLSAGDFAIVVRSKKPDTAYHISTYLRKRRANKRGVVNVNNAYVLYKTYTLSTIGMANARCEERLNTDRNRFIIRGCFSNTYWKNQDMVKEFLDKLKGDMDRLYPLSGRYDFTVGLTEEEFYQVMFPQESSETEQREENERSSLACYLRYLIENGYISCINERYLMEKAENGWELSEKEIVSQSIFLWDREEEIKELFKENKQQIEELLKMHKIIAEKSRNILGYRKNIQQYLFLLKREISLCKSINELSDTRIYAKVLAEQLEAVLDSADKYIELCCQRTENDKWIDILENDLRKAVVTIDSFAQYIRNNNLQSIQTPNYNIETSMGVEKVLIGYSELLWYFIEFYTKKISKATTRNYLAVMVPDLHARDVNVDVIFPLDRIGNAAPEESGKDKCLIVIGSPTLEEATDFPVMFPALFHEVAHQFRYEKRGERNQAVLRATVKEIMRYVANDLSKLIDDKVGMVPNDGGRLSFGLAEGLTEAFIESGYLEKNIIGIEKKSLAQFEDELFDSVNELFSIWLWKSDLEMQLKEFVFELRYELDYSDEESHEVLLELKQHIAGETEDVDEIKKWALILAGICTSNYMDETEKERWNLLKQESKKEVLDWEVEWGQIFNTGICDKCKEIQRIDRALVMYLNWLDEYKKRRDSLNHYESKVWKKKVEAEGLFEINLFSYMRQYWEENARQSFEIYATDDKTETETTDMVMVPSYRYWTLVGRYLGLDYKPGDLKKFNKVITEALAGYDPNLELSFLGLYREETADLLMCNVMDMKPIQYLNLAVTLFALNNGSYGGIEMERIFCVLYIQWCYDPEKGMEEAWEVYQRVCGGIFEAIQHISDKMLEEGGINKIGIMGDFPKCQILGGKDAAANREVEKLIEMHISYLERCREKIEEQLDEQTKYKVFGELDNILRLCNMLADLIWNGSYYWRKLHSEEEVLEDLARGRKALSKLRQNDDDNIIKEIFKVGDSVSEYLSLSHSQKGVGNGQELNEKCVKLLLSMYYHNRIRIAQEGREGSDNEN